jgi:hypothetical protein
MLIPSFPPKTSPLSAVQTFLISRSAGTRTASAQTPGEVVQADASQQAARASRDGAAAQTPWEGLVCCYRKDLESSRNRAFSLPVCEEAARLKLRGVTREGQPKEAPIVAQWSGISADGHGK